MRRIASRIADTGGVALIIDYGHAQTAVGDTLQAMKDSAFADALAEPGEADLTAHVDFAALAAAAHEAEVRVLGPVSQGRFLTALGLRSRADRLKRDNPEHAADIDAAVVRLTRLNRWEHSLRFLPCMKAQRTRRLPGSHERSHTAIPQSRCIERASRRAWLLRTQGRRVHGRLRLAQLRSGFVRCTGLGGGESRARNRRARA